MSGLRVSGSLFALIARWGDDAVGEIGREIVIRSRKGQRMGPCASSWHKTMNGESSVGAIRGETANKA